MGLDIRAFNGLNKCDIQSEDAYLKHTNCTYLTSKGDMFFEQSGGLNGYYYHNNEYMMFRAGSYSAYNNWRELLSYMIGFPNALSIWEIVKRDISIGNILSEPTSFNIPFIELIYFSDCEGVIGEKICKKLYEDFISYKNEANKIKNSDWISLYDDFLKAFKIGSNNGCVQFC
jgi:hypothetical protein